MAVLEAIEAGLQPRLVVVLFVVCCCSLCFVLGWGGVLLCFVLFCFGVIP